MARRLVEDFGGEVPSDLDSLTSLPGVGRKTANVILSVIFDRPTMAVDTHVFRVSERIGLTTGSKTPLATEKALVKYIPEELIPKAHHWLILHGRYVCKARRPDCLNCFLTSVCRFYSKMVESTFLFIIEILGTLAFGVSGVRLLQKKHFDWFGAYTLGVITAIGGGTVRDVLPDIPVFWMQTWLYLAVTGVSFLIVLAFTKVLTSDSKSLFMFDAVGLTLFVITGIEKTLAIGYPMWVAIIMGMITGSFGSILRDVLLNEEPLFFRKDIYATACLAGGALYWMTAVFGGPVWLQQSLCVRPSSCCAGVHCVTDGICPK